MKLKELRLAERKTQMEVANHLGIKQSSYQNYEAGITEPNVENLIKLANFYNVSIDYLVDRDFNNQVYLTEQERAMIESFKKLSEVNKIKVVSYTLGVLSTQE